MPDELTLLERLVAIPSVSGEEGPLALFVEQSAREWGLDAMRDETSVRVEVRGRASGPTLALVSHLDVVPPGAGWTRDPFTPVVEGSRLYGRGSGDAKASVAASGVAANAKYDQGIAVFTLPKAGAMVAAAVGGQKFKFAPIR